MVPTPTRSLPAAATLADRPDSVTLKDSSPSLMKSSLIATVKVAVVRPVAIEPEPLVAA